MQKPGTLRVSCNRRADRDAAPCCGQSCSYRRENRYDLTAAGWKWSGSAGWDSAAADCLRLAAAMLSVWSTPGGNHAPVAIPERCPIADDAARIAWRSSQIDRAILPAGRWFLA